MQSHNVIPFYSLDNKCNDAYTFNNLLNSLDHKINTYLKSFFSMLNFITKHIQYISYTNFQIIRYYSIIADNIHSILLSILYKLLGQIEKIFILPFYSSSLISHSKRKPLVDSIYNSYMIHVITIYINAAYHIFVGHPDFTITIFRYSSITRRYSVFTIIFVYC